ncbi:MAG: biotin--[acetyl-CoA-carboxylase] ligase [Bacteroidales bacterium]
MLHTGRTRIVLSQTDSTNMEAFRLLERGQLEEGTLVITREQTAGRGQGNTSWESEPGSNLTFSVILKPSFLEVSRQFLLTKVISLAVKEVIERRVAPHRVSIKWPNDIYIGNGKVCGMLIENRIMGSQFQVCVAGIGINVNQRVFRSQAPNPVSVSQITQSLHDRDEILNDFCSTLDKRYLQLQNQQTALLDHDYLQALLGMNKPREFMEAGRKFTATITGVSEYGWLILMDERGCRQEYDLKQIRFLF